MSGRAPSNVGANTNSSNDASNPAKAITAARKRIGELMSTNPDLGPQFIRIAFYDAISYDPIAKVDGPNGSIRISEGLALENSLKSAFQELDKIKQELYSDVEPTTPRLNLGTYLSYADLYQLAGIEAVKNAGGPSIKFLYGRTDSCIPKKIPILNEDAKAEDIKAKFHRIGFSDKEIVALSSAYFYWMNYKEIPTLDNSYYRKLLIIKSLPSTLHYWECLLSDASFHKHVVLFGEDNKSFQKEYASAHQKLCELGFKHFPEPILTEAEYHDIKHGIAFAVVMTILFGFVGFFYESMRA